jgi:hypothetical protein
MKTPYMLIKLDMSKDFDKLRWKHIKQILKAFGFHHDWIHWILSIISFTMFYLLINGFPSPPFHPNHGIRQGDPLYPFIFIIMVKGLGRSLKATTENNELQGLSLHNSDDPLTHN